jgi:hypothetical protein
VHKNSYGTYAMPNEELLNAIAGGLAVVITIGGILMMFTDFFTKKKPR